MADEAKSSKKDGSGMKVVRGLDVERYMGLWYEIAAFPSLFQPKDGRWTQATYALESDGKTLRVLNETWSRGKRSYIKGTAYKADPASDEAKLKVKFYLPPFLPFFPIVGDYWVLFLDDDYQHALIGQPSRKDLWILCRLNYMDDEVYSQLVERAKEAGYDVSKLRKTPQSEPPQEIEVASSDKGFFWWIKFLFGEWIKSLFGK